MQNGLIVLVVPRTEQACLVFAGIVDHPQRFIGVRSKDHGIKIFDSSIIETYGDRIRQTLDAGYR